MGAMRSLVPASFSLTYRSPGNTSNNPGDWFGPLSPMKPLAPESVKGRILDFPTGYNLNTQARSYEAVTFAMLRNFADSYDLIRILIETRKDQMARLKWNIVPRDKNLNKRGAPIPVATENKIDEVTAFFHRPDQEHFWAEWLSLVLEDLFVLDAPTLYRRKTIGGKLYALQPIDGGTIKRVIDDFGNTPMAPNPAYQQILKGYPAVDYSVDELIYRPRVNRTHKIYGYSPVEQIIMTINIGMRRQVWQLQSFTEGNMPEALIGTPDAWTPDQVAQFQTWFDSMLVNNTGERRRARFVPGGVAKGYVPTKPDEIFGKAEEWLARVCCAAFSIAPQPFVSQVNRATAETAHEAAISEGLAPVQNWVKALIDTVLIDDFGAADLEFKWLEEDELDPNVKSQIIDREHKAGRLTTNEARGEQGLDPFDDVDADRPLQYTAAGFAPMFLSDEEKQAKADASAAIAGATAADTGQPGDTNAADEGTDAGDDNAGPPGDTSSPAGDTSPVGKSDQARDESGRFAGGDSSIQLQGSSSSHDGEGHMVSNGQTTVHTDANGQKFERTVVPMEHGNAKVRFASPGGKTEFHTSASTHEELKSATERFSNNREHFSNTYTKADMGVAEESPLPFSAKGCGCNLAKAGRASSSNVLDPLRPFAAKLEARLARRLHATLIVLGQSVGKQVVAALSAVAKTDYPPDFDIDKLLANLDLSVFSMDEEELRIALETIGQDAGRIALAQVGMAMDNQELVDRVNERAVEWARERAGELVNFDNLDPMLADSTRDMLRSTIADGMEANLSMQEIGAELADIYAFSEDRANLIAATEITSANSEGALAGYEEAVASAGITVQKSWLVLEDGCPICQENADAGPIDLDEDFPSGDSAPGAHPNCRCVLVPEVTDDQGNTTEGEATDEGDNLEQAAMPDDMVKSDEVAEVSAHEDKVDVAALEHLSKALADDPVDAKLPLGSKRVTKIDFNFDEFGAIVGLTKTEG